MDVSLARVDELDARDSLELLSGNVRVDNAHLDQVYAFPDIIRYTRAGVRELNVAERELSLPLDRILGSAGRALQYTVAMKPVGKHSFPGAGYQRAYSLLAHQNQKANPHFLVWFPGFGHQLVSRTLKWEMALQAQIARALGVSILCVNPGGRGVPGSATARGISSISTRQLTEDTVYATRKLVTALLQEAGVSADAQIDMIVTGHSLGAYLARAFAHDIARRQDRFTLRGVIQEAPVGAGTGEDLRYGDHWRAILPHLAEAFGRALLPLRGMQFKMSDLQRLFYGRDCAIEHVAATAWALVPGEAANFLGISLLPGDLKRFVETLTLAQDLMHRGTRAVGSKIIFPTRDAIFARGGLNSASVRDRMCHTTKRLGTKAIHFSGTHCYVKAGATLAEQIAVRDAYREAYGLPELELDRF